MPQLKGTSALKGREDVRTSTRSLGLAAGVGFLRFRLFPLLHARLFAYALG